MTVGLSTPPGDRATAAPRFGLVWALKRALLGFAILFVMFGGGAWLLYATIEPDRADAREAGGVVLESPAPSARAPHTVVSRQ